MIVFQQEVNFVFSEFKDILAQKTQNHSVFWNYFWQTFLSLLYCRLYLCIMRLYFFIICPKHTCWALHFTPLKEKYFLKCHFRIIVFPHFFPPSRCVLFQSIPVRHTWYLFWSVHKGVFIQTVLCHCRLRSIGAFVLQIHIYGQVKRAAEIFCLMTIFLSSAQK